MYLSSKRLAVLALPILLSACALPASFTIASLAADGVSYATSGKGLSDHAISAVANEDCAMWRALKDRPICRQADVPETMVAATPAPEVPAVVIAVAPAAGEPVAPENLVASATEFGEFEVTAAAFAAMLMAEESEAPAAVLEVAPETARLPKLYGGQATAETPAEMPATDAAPADRETAAEPVQLALLAPSLPKMEAEPKLGSFVVLGSFLKEARARDVMKLAHDFQPRIIRVRVRGKLFHRVVSGPYASSSIATMRRTLIGEGFRDAWTTTLCQNKPCAGPSARRRPRP